MWLKFGFHQGERFWVSVSGDTKNRTSQNLSDHIYEKNND